MKTAPAMDIDRLLDGLDLSVEVTGDTQALISCGYFDAPTGIDDFSRSSMMAGLSLGTVLDGANTANLTESKRPAAASLECRFWNQLSKRIQTVTANSPLDDALPNCLNFRIPDIDSVDLLSALPKIAMSTGSACNSSDQNPSHVLMAIGLDGAMARSSIRVGFGRFTTTEEIDEAAGMIAKAVQRLQSS